MTALKSNSISALKSRISKLSCFPNVLEYIQTRACHYIIHKLKLNFYLNSEKFKSKIEQKLLNNCLSNKIVIQNATENCKHSYINNKTSFVLITEHQY